MQSQGVHSQFFGFTGSGLESDEVSEANREITFMRKTMNFHQVATVCGIWFLAFCVGVFTLSRLRTILVPLFWAFFLMMGLVPATDFVESILMRLLCRGRTAKVAAAAELPNSEENGQQYEQFAQFGPRQESEFSEEEADCCQTIIRTIAVVIVALSFVLFIALFFVMIYVSALHMKEGWQHYQDGLKKVSDSTNRFVSHFSKDLPPAVLDSLSKKAYTGLEETLGEVVSFFLADISESLVSLLMMLLYMVFWLCQPMHVGQNTTTVFRRYILLKSVASAGYAFSVWLLLHFCNIDLAIVFGLVTFLFNFVPEVGPFLAMSLPLPVVLFDGRLTNQWLTLATVIGGNMALKCVWANIIEVKLVESQQEMKMHPVVILFFVAFFGWIWGATGMLLSVPLVAVVKASIELFPAVYRDPILVFLEGDRRAPANFNKMIRTKTADPARWPPHREKAGTL